MMHVLEKLWSVSRVLLFSCRTPKHVFILALVNRAFCECMLEYQHSKSIFDRLFDARNEWQSEEDVETCWKEAAAIMVRQKTAPQEQPPPFDPDLLADMVAAIKAENARAGSENAAIPTRVVDERWAAWIVCPLYYAPYYSQRYGAFAAENPLPAGIFARNRLAQCRGTLQVAFRGCRPLLGWTEHVKTPGAHGDFRGQQEAFWHDRLDHVARFVVSARCRLESTLWFVGFHAVARIAAGAPSPLQRLLW